MASESPLNDTKKATGTVKSAAGFAQKIKQLVNTIKAARLAIAAGTGPAGWAVGAAMLAAKYKKQIIKAAAALAALIAYLLYLLGLKLAGLVAGLAFGAITGLPLLAIPGAGPFLYAGWTAYWGYRGFIDPTGTIHLATHPWEPITNAFSSARNFIGRVFNATGIETGNVTTTISSGISGGASYAGNFIAGTVSSAWNLGISGLGNALGGALNIGSRFFGMFAGTSGAEAATLSQVAVGGTIGTVATATVVVGIMTNAAFFNPEADIVRPPPGQNDAFTITKTASPSILDNPGQNVEFTITLTAKKPLTEILCADSMRVQTESGELTIDKDINGAQFAIIACPANLTASATYSYKFSVPTLANYNNSIIINTIQVKALSQGDTIPTVGSFTASVIIGNPPAACPQGWPTRTGSVSQGPEGGTSHGDPPVTYGTGGLEAIDIGVEHENVYSTVDGTVTDIYSGSGAEDLRITVVPFNCPNLEIVGYWHLLSVDPLVRINEPIIFGQVVGISGLQGTGYHTHYQFNAAFDRDPQITDFLPKAVPRACNGDCNVSIP
jgi:hypothetical protein